MQHAAEIGSPSAVAGKLRDSTRYAKALLASKGRENRMPAAKAPSVQLSPDHDRQLKALVRAHSTPQNEVDPENWTGC